MRTVAPAGAAGAAGLAAALLALVGAPGPAAAQAPEMESGYAVLAVDGETGRLAGAAVSSRMAGAGEGLLVEPGTGVAFASGRHGHGAAAAALSALRSGTPPGEAARAGAAESGSGRVVVLDPGCADGAAGGESVVGPVERVRGRSGGLCYVAVAVQPADPGGLDRLVSALEGGRPPLARRLAGALEAALPREPALGPARSAALWIAPPEGAGAAARHVLDRSGIRLQTGDHPRPVARLTHQLGLVEARELAGLASAEIAGGRFEEAAARADSALELDPGSTAAWMQRGRALLYAGRTEAAEEAFRRMLELDPTLLRFLGDPAGPSVNEDVIPYAPRLILRLDVYRRAYFRTLDFGPGPATPEGLPAAPSPRDTTGVGPDGGPGAG